VRPPSVAPAAAPTPPPKVAASVAPTGVTCPSCGTVNGVGERSCRRCGTAFPGPDLGRYDPRPDAVSPIDAVQPGEAKVRRGPDRVAPQGPTVVGGVACPRCGTANPRDRRFCSRCGLPMGQGAAGQTSLAPLERRSWWRRFLDRLRGRRSSTEHANDGRSAAERAATKAYRHGLGVRYRIGRVLGALVAVGIIAAAFGVGGVNPRAWIRDGWHRLRGDQYQTVTGKLEAVADPLTAENGNFPAEWAVDGIKTTLRPWATEWNGVPAGAACTDPKTTGGATSALVIKLPKPTDVARIRVDAGLDAEDRLNQWRPLALEVQGDDGLCQQIPLKDEAGTQDVDVALGTVQVVRIAVVDAAEPEGVSTKLLSIREIGFLTKR
jgi:hypothetical protein